MGRISGLCWEEGKETSQIKVCLCKLEGSFQPPGTEGHGPAPGTKRRGLSEVWGKATRQGQNYRECGVGGM